MKVPHNDSSEKGNLKRTYWPRDMALQVRRIERRKLESELAQKNKQWKQADKQKALDDKWGEYCESGRSIEEGQAVIGEHLGIERREHDFPHKRKG